jgi:thiol-disulfide isomerase/thioredoxin
MKRKILFASILTTLFLFTGCETKSEIDENLIANSQNNEPVREEFIAKNFKLTTTDEKTIEFTSTPSGLEFKDYKDKKVVLINVFATWCPPCIKELPYLISLQEKYKDNFQIISVLFEKDKSKEEILAFIEKHGINYPITMGDENFRLAKDMGDIQKIPEMFLFTKDGSFIKKFVGETKKATLEKYINLALEESK